MASYPLQVVTPKGMCFEGNADSLTVNTTTGQISILAGHTNYIAAVVIGKAKIVFGNDTIHAVCGNGFLSMENGKCTLLTNSFDTASALNADKINAELADAEKLLADAKSSTDKAIAKDRIKLANLRLSILDM